MKKVLVLVSLVAAVTAFSQGTVNFQNRNTTVSPQINAPISYAATAGVAGSRQDAAAVNINGAGSLVVGSQNFGGQFAMAGLYGAPAGFTEDNLILLVPAVGFRSGAAAGYVNVGSTASRMFPSTGTYAVAGNTPAVVQIRAWDMGVAGIDSYEAAQAYLAQGRSGYIGRGALMNITTGGGGTPPGPAADLIGLTAFSINFVPEPSIIGLGILGAIGGLMVFRRRS